jgi:hypothetical protein
MPAEKAKPPVHEIRLARLKALIWERTITEGSYPLFAVTIVRIFKDGTMWRETSSFGRDDLLLVAKVADLAHSWICTATQERGAPHERESHAFPKNES